jgi:hypothetical protein
MIEYDDDTRRTYGSRWDDRRAVSRNASRADDY